MTYQDINVMNHALDLLGRHAEDKSDTVGHGHILVVIEELTEVIHRAEGALK